MTSKEKSANKNIPSNCSSFYETTNGRKIRFARIVGKEELLPFVEDLVFLANHVLPDEYDEIESEFFLADRVVRANGEEFDISNQWEGLSFLVFDENQRVIGFTAGNISKKEQVTKGYSRITLVHEDYQREGVGSYLITLLGMSLIQQGAETLGGTTEESNTKMINLIGSFKAEATVDGRFLRYEFDLPKTKEFLKLIAQRVQHIGEIARELNIKSI